MPIITSIVSQLCEINDMHTGSAIPAKAVSRCSKFDEQQAVAREHFTTILPSEEQQATSDVKKVPAKVPTTSTNCDVSNGDSIG